MRKGFRQYSSSVNRPAESPNVHKFRSPPSINHNGVLIITVLTACQATYFVSMELIVRMTLKIFAFPSVSFPSISNSEPALPFI